MPRVMHWLNGPVHRSQQRLQMNSFCGCTYNQTIFAQADSFLEFGRQGFLCDAQHQQAGCQ